MSSSVNGTNAIVSAVVTFLEGDVTSNSPISAGSSLSGAQFFSYFMAAAVTFLLAKNEWTKTSLLVAMISLAVIVQVHFLILNSFDL